MRPGITRWIGTILMATALIPVRADSQERFNGCGMTGNARGKELRQLNRLKNRYNRPMPEDYSRYDVSLGDILEPGDDGKRFTNSAAAQIVGYVRDVKIGGIESCNCNARDARYRDTHIVLVTDPKEKKASRTVIAEVTPRWREVMRKRGIDWSTEGLRKALLHKWVRVRGWMLYDWHYTDEAENTNPGGKKNWRATAWEVHPVISIEILEAPR